MDLGVLTATGCIVLLLIVGVFFLVAFINITSRDRRYQQSNRDGSAGENTASSEGLLHSHHHQHHNGGGSHHHSSFGGGHHSSGGHH